MKRGADPRGQRAHPPSPHRAGDVRMGGQILPLPDHIDMAGNDSEAASALVLLGKQHGVRNLCSAESFWTSDFLLPASPCREANKTLPGRMREVRMASGAGSTRLPCVCRGRGNRQGSGGDEEQIFWYQRGQRIDAFGAWFSRELKLDFSPKELGTDADEKIPPQTRGKQVSASADCSSAEIRTRW